MAATGCRKVPVRQVSQSIREKLVFANKTKELHVVMEFAVHISAFVVVSAASRRSVSTD